MLRASNCIRQPIIWYATINSVAEAASNRALPRKLTPTPTRGCRPSARTSTCGRRRPVQLAGEALQRRYVRRSPTTRAKLRRRDSEPTARPRRDRDHHMQHGRQNRAQQELRRSSVPDWPARIPRPPTRMRVTHASPDHACAGATAALAASKASLMLFPALLPGAKN